MTLHSMTGFGTGEHTGSGLTVEVEIGSVNRKQFDVRVALPRSLSVLEPRVREYLGNRVARGSLTATVRVRVSSGSRLKSIAIDEHLSRAFITRLRRTARALQLDDDLSASSLLRLPEVVQYRELTEDSGKVWNVLRRALKQAVGELTAMREREGAALARDLTARFTRLKKRLESIRKQAPRVPERQRRALQKRLREAGCCTGELEAAVAREIVMFAERCDITEEIVRLDSHFAQVDRMLRAKKPVGRALDFVCQELLREINTIGSKANDARISGHVIHFKTELESVREQVQNIE